MAMITPSPEKLILSICINPSMMNQIPNKIMLRFLGSLDSFIGRFLSANEVRVFAGKHERASRTDTQDFCGKHFNVIASHRNANVKELTASSGKQARIYKYAQMHGHLLRTDDDHRRETVLLGSHVPSYRSRQNRRAHSN
jgi:hypothetical protein